MNPLTIRLISLFGVCRAGRLTMLHGCCCTRAVISFRVWCRRGSHALGSSRDEPRGRNGAEWSGRSSDHIVFGHHRSGLRRAGDRYTADSAHWTKRRHGASFRANTHSHLDGRNRRLPSAGCYCLYLGELRPWDDNCCMIG